MTEAIPLCLITEADFQQYVFQQSLFHRNIISTYQFTAKPETYCPLFHQQTGELKKILVGITNPPSIFSLSHLPFNLSRSFNIAAYYIENDKNFSKEQLEKLIISWELGSYRFDRYLKNNINPKPALLNIDSINKNIDLNFINLVSKAYQEGRDAINMPAADCRPADLSDIAKNLAVEYQADFSEIIGEDLRKNNYQAIYAVGRGSANLPRLIDISWGDPHHPKVTLVGKGVCFDTGGIQIKSHAGMQLMRKDMAGAAHVLALGQLIMGSNLPVRLRILIPAVENSVSDKSYYPGDVITMRNGDTVEISDTDAEGRLILADALITAAAEQPELLIDIATLTGAARIAVGTEISAMFANNHKIAQEILNYSYQEEDIITQLPLYLPYKKLLSSEVATLKNSEASGYGGAITAALFLQHFIFNNNINNKNINIINWLHFDLMAWNVTARPGRPIGGELMAIRSIFAYFKNRFK